MDSDPEEPDSPRESVRKTKFSGVHSIKKIAFTDEEIVQAVDRVKISKGDGGAMKVLYGTVGSKPSGQQVFLPDTGASINIIPEQTSKENGIKILRFDKRSCSGSSAEHAALLTFCLEANLAC